MRTSTRRIWSGWDGRMGPLVLCECHIRTCRSFAHPPKMRRVVQTVKYCIVEPAYVHSYSLRRASRTGKEHIWFTPKQSTKRALTGARTCSIGLFSAAQRSSDWIYIQKLVELSKSCASLVQKVSGHWVENGHRVSRFDIVGWSIKVNYWRLC